MLLTCQRVHASPAGQYVDCRPADPNTSPAADDDVIGGVFHVLQHVVSLYVMAAAVVSMVLGRVIATMPFVFGGAYSAWFYLRFLQSNASNPAEQC